MNDRRCVICMDAPEKYLLVLRDGVAAARLATRIAADGATDVTMASSLEAARRLMESARFDVVVAEADMPDGSGLSLFLRETGGAADADRFLWTDQPTAEQALEALRLGAVDVFTHPHEPDEILLRLRRAAEARRRRRRETLRHARLRELSRRIIRDRREVRKQVDLVCRDLVGAYRELAEKVIGLSREDA
ncbi:MAG: response regulator [Phycisphaerae bacterium]|nr:response regulator [Phycisphaerae bacterium]NUQ46724.1 response regulator [Phycisphaerae bacterium]